MPFEITSEAARVLASRVSKRWEIELRLLAGDKEVDKTGDIARLLRPLSSVRNNGNRVKVHTWHPELRYSLEDFELPPLVTESEPSAEATYRTASIGVISEYLDHIGLWTPQDVLKHYGDENVPEAFSIHITDSLNSVRFLGFPVERSLSIRGIPCQQSRKRQESRELLPAIPSDWPDTTNRSSTATNLKQGPKLPASWGLAEHA